MNTYRYVYQDMFTISNLVKTLLVSSIVAAGFVFYFASSTFQESVGIHGNPEIGKVDAFLETANSMESKSEFWLHLFRGWLDSFVMLFIGCAILLSIIRTPNKK